MKKTLFLSLILGVSNVLVGQIAIGLTVGEHFAKIKQTGEFAESPFSIQPDEQENTILYGFTLGIPIELNLSKKISLYAVPSYLQKGGGFTATFTSTYLVTTYSGTETCHYLELPVLGKFYYLKEKFNGYLTFGPSIGYVVNKQTQIESSETSVFTGVLTNGDSYDQTIKSEDLHDAGLDRFDFSLNIGTGAEFKVGIGKMLVNVNYMHGVTDILYHNTESSNGAHQYNRGLSTTIGYLIPISY